MRTQAYWNIIEEVMKNAEENCLTYECDDGICESCLCRVAASGDIALFKNMIPNSFDGMLSGFNTAAECGHLNFMKYWVERYEGREKFREITCAMAAKSGNVEMLKFMEQSGARWIWRAAAYAAGNGMFDALKYLHSINAPIDGQSIMFASANGHQEIVEWLQKIDVQRDSDGTDYQLRKLRWNRNYDNLLKNI